MSRRPWLSPLTARSPHEAHRVSTPLELLFDLVIVVAVAQASSGLHHALAEGHVGSGVLTYSMVFFGIWWAWVNFTWFGSAYDNDDVAYRLLVFLQLTGALVFAAGIPSFEHGDLTVGVVGYVVMRLGLVTQWLRASRGDPPRRRCARRYTFGVLLVQAAWVVYLLAAPPSLALAGFWTLAAVEMLVPAWAERAAPTTWHPHHIAERYGLFTIITLGESILAASLAVRAATEAGAKALVLAPVVTGGLLIVFSFWWLYFDRPGHEVLDALRSPFLWGYGHYFVFGSAAAVGAGLAVSVDHAVGKTAISSSVAGLSVAGPVALYLACLWALHARCERSKGARLVAAVAIVGVLLTPFTAQPVLLTGVLMAGLVAYKAMRLAST